MLVTSRGRMFLSGNHYHTRLGGKRHDPQRFMSKTVYVPDFNRDTVEFASRERDESKPGIKTLLPFISEKHYGREQFGEFSRSHSDLRCWPLAS